MLLYEYQPIIIGIIILLLLLLSLSYSMDLLSDTLYHVIRRITSIIMSCHKTSYLPHHHHQLHCLQLYLFILADAFLLTMITASSSAPAAAAYL